MAHAADALLLLLVPRLARARYSEHISGVSREVLVPVAAVGPGLPPAAVSVGCLQIDRIFKTSDPIALAFLYYFTNHVYFRGFIRSVGLSWDS